MSSNDEHGRNKNPARQKRKRLPTGLLKSRQSSLVTSASILMCYDFLRSVKPFSNWDLPDEIEASVLDDAESFGEFIQPSEINISRVLVFDMDTFVRTMAHEMIHLRQHQLGLEPDHGKTFWNLSRDVCSHFGWRQGDI